MSHKSKNVFRDSNNQPHPWTTNDGVYYTPLNARPFRLIERKMNTVVVEIAKPFIKDNLKHTEPKEIIGEFAIFELEIPMSTFLKSTCA